MVEDAQMTQPRSFRSPRFCAQFASSVSWLEFPPPLVVMITSTNEELSENSHFPQKLQREVQVMEGNVHSSQRPQYCCTETLLCTKINEEKHRGRDSDLRVGSKLTSNHRCTPLE